MSGRLWTNIQILCEKSNPSYGSLAEVSLAFRSHCSRSQSFLCVQERFCPLCWGSHRFPWIVEMTVTWVISRTTQSILLYWTQSSSCIKVTLNRQNFLLSLEVSCSHTAVSSGAVYSFLMPAGKLVLVCLSIDHPCIIYLYPYISLSSINHLLSILYQSSIYYLSIYLASIYIYTYTQRDI